MTFWSRGLCEALANYEKAMVNANPGVPGHDLSGNRGSRGMISQETGGPGA